MEVIKEPLVLASSLINVWRIGNALPKYRWQSGLAFAQTLMPATASLEFRAQRLIDYHRPWLKFFLGKAARVAAIALAVFTTAFLWRFYSDDNHLHLGVAGGEGLHFYSYLCEPFGKAGQITASNQEMTADRFVRVITSYVEAINAENYVALQNVFSRKVLEAYPLEKIEPLYKILLSNYGRILKLDVSRLVAPDQAIFAVHFERVVLDMQVVLDDEDKITGSIFLPNFNDHCELAKE